jgi:gas vesicle protein GvpG
VLLIDDLLIGGFKFVLRRLADAVESERSDEGALREELLAAQMRLELGEITEDEFKEQEARLLAQIREARQLASGEAPEPGRLRVTGVEATFTGEEHLGAAEEHPDEERPESPAPRSRKRR